MFHIASRTGKLDLLKEMSSKSPEAQKHMLTSDKVNDSIIMLSINCLKLLERLEHSSPSM